MSKSWHKVLRPPRLTVRKLNNAQNTKQKYRRKSSSLSLVMVSYLAINPSKCCLEVDLFSIFAIILFCLEQIMHFHIQSPRVVRGGLCGGYLCISTNARISAMACAIGFCVLPTGLGGHFVIVSVVDFYLFIRSWPRYTKGGGLWEGLENSIFFLNAGAQYIMG